MRCDRFVALLLISLWAILAGCEAGTCTRHSDCATGLVCGENGRCVVPPATPPAADADGGATLLDGASSD